MTFEVEDAQDLIRLLEAKPELRAGLRRIVLTEDLLALPEQFARSRVETDLRFRELAEAQRRTDRHLEALTEAQRHTDERLADLIEVVSGMGTQIGVLKGELLEMRYHARAAAYLGRLFRRVRPLSTTELAELLDDAVEQGKLIDAERDEILLVDFVARGRHRETGAEVYLVVEVSWGVGPYDVERAAERARLLSKLGTPALLVVAGKVMTKQAASLAEEQHVQSLIEGRRSALATGSELP
jgi:predicted house-cleaning noncanonical NTP pyrophosphatase (MazG superfamily)